MNKRVPFKIVINNVKYRNKWKCSKLTWTNTLKDTEVDLNDRGEKKSCPLAGTSNINMS